MFNKIRSYFTPFKIFEWAVVFVAVTVLSVAVYAAELPKLQSHVNDYANVLSRSDQQRLNGRLTEFENSTPGHPQIVILTVPSLKGEDLDSFTNDVFHDWKLGHAKYNNGVLALFAMAERKNRIEVGYDLEPTLTDSVSKHILDSLRTQEKAGNWYGAFSSMIDQLTPIVAGAAKEDVDLVKNVPATPSSSNSTGFPIMSLLFLLVLIGVVWYVIRQMTKPSNIKRPSNMDTYSNTSDGYMTKHRSDPPTSDRSYYPVPPVSRPYAPPPSYDPPRPHSTSSTLGSAAVGFGAGMAAESLLNNSRKKRDNDDDSSSSSSSWSSPSSSSWSSSDSSSSSSSSSSSDSSYSGGGGDSGGGGSDSSW